jgi:hypothetical protein
MKIGLKVLIGLALIVAVSYWAVNSVLPRSYEGSDLSFEAGGGPVTVTNPSNEAIPAQLVGESRSFSVVSAVEGLTGTSKRQGSGASATYTIDFELLPGESEFAITRGSDVNFVANTETRLEATVQPVSAKSLRTILIVTAVVVVGTLFYISRITNHRWINRFRRPATPVPDLEPVS